MSPYVFYRTCEICGFRVGRNAEKKRKFIARFPLDPDRCRQWVKIIGGEDLAYIPVEKLHQSKFVCADHFKIEDLNKKKNRLKGWAIPSLGIKSQPLPDDLLVKFPTHIAKSVQTMATVPDVALTIEVREVPPKKQLPDLHSIILASNKRIHDYYMPTSSGIPSQKQECPASPNKRTLHDHNYYMSTPSGISSEKQEFPASANKPIHDDHDYYMSTPSGIPSEKQECPASANKPIHDDHDCSMSTPSGFPSEKQECPASANKPIHDDHDYYMSTPSGFPSEKQECPASANKPIHDDHDYYMSTPSGFPSEKKECPASANKPIHDDHDCSMSTPSGIPSEKQECPASANKPIHDDQDCSMSTPSGIPSEKQECPVSANKLIHDGHDYYMSTPRGISSEKQECPDVSPATKKLLKKLQTSKNQLKILQKKVQVIESIESPMLKALITSTVKNHKRVAKGRRWSNNDKGLALSIYKKSPKAYRFLRHLVPLPSIRTLQVVLQKMILEPGVNDALLNHLGKISQNFKTEDKTCVIMFDEIALKKRLILNTSKDKIEGYEDMGEEGRTNKIANHALVFMMQGVVKKYKQPLAYYFVKGTISTQKLTCLIKNIIRKITAEGFNVIATVCDQGPTNIGAINCLKRSSGNTIESNFFELDGQKVYIIYDVPHLFKSIRNNFLQAGEVEWNNKKAKWSHLIHLEEKNRETLHFTKITKKAVEPKFKGKMKVKLAAQILSNTVAAVLKLLAESSPEPARTEIQESSEVIKDFDHLFDLTNGPASYKDVKKKLRENVTKNSFHHDEWQAYKEKLKTLKFLKNGQQLKNVKCVKGYLITLTSLQDIWTYFQIRGLKWLNLRQLNQDALENFFGLIRQHSPTNRNPTCHHFTAAMKSSILTRLSTPVSRGGNCEQDQNNIMFDFHNLVFEDNSQPDRCANTTAPLDNEDDPIVDYSDDTYYPLLLSEEYDNLNNFDNQPVVYVSGFVAKKMITLHQNCNRCCDVLQGHDISNEMYKYISFKEWDDNPRLTYPSIYLCNEVKLLTKLFDENIKNLLHINDIIKYSQGVMLRHLDMSWLCQEHVTESSRNLVRIVSLLLIRNECRKINESFSLLEDNSADAAKKAQQAGSAR